MQTQLFFAQFRGPVRIADKNDISHVVEDTDTNVPCDAETLRFVCSRCTWEKEGITAQLSREPKVPPFLGCPQGFSMKHPPCKLAASKCIWAPKKVIGDLQAAVFVDRQYHAKLVRCRVASETLQRNWSLKFQAHCWSGAKCWSIRNCTCPWFAGKLCKAAKASHIELHGKQFSYLHFGGCHFAFWRLKLFWGCFIERGEPQEGGYFGFPSNMCDAESPARWWSETGHYRPEMSE